MHLTRLLPFAAALLVVRPLAGQGPATGMAVEEDVRALSADSMEGRATGRPGADRAATYLVRRFRQLGLRELPAAPGWRHHFVIAPDAPAARGTDLGGRAADNVVGVVPGRDPRLAGEYVVLGAHYDHLGTGGAGSLDPGPAGGIHNGADDNASGVAALLEAARLLAAAPPARTVVFVAFAGEELGLLGSSAFVRDAVVPRDRVRAMLNFDMVGRLREDRLVAYGVETAAEFRGVLDSLNQRHRFALHAEGDGYGPSDHTSFTVAGVPVLHFFTGTHGDYHRTTDDWERVDPAGVARIAALAADVARVVGDRGPPLTFVASAAPAPRAGARTGGYGAYLGSIPDMTTSPGGVRLAGVTAGAPADQAGLRAGDILTRIGAHAVPDLQAMTDALRAHAPGDTVEVTFRRDGAERRTRVVLGRRGG